jgi:hypothetical protein
MIMEEETNEKTGAGGASNVPSPSNSPPATLKITQEETELERSLHGLDTSKTHISGKIDADIEEILSSVRLPERRSVPGSAPPKAPPAPVASVPQATPAPTQDDDKPPIVTPLRTLRDDLQRIIRTRRLSPARAATIQIEKKQKEERAQVTQAVASEQVTQHVGTRATTVPHASTPSPQTKERSRRVFAILFSAGLLFFLGGAALFGVYFIATRGIAPISSSRDATSSILFAEQSVALPLDGRPAATLKQSLAEVRKTPNGPVNSITRIIPTIAPAGDTTGSQNAPATLSQFFTALDMHPPSDLVRALGNDFFFGMHNAAGSSPVFVIPVVSYDRAFAGMLSWENSMNADLVPIFTYVPKLKTGAGGLPTDRTFVDIVIRNYDVRALQDDGGTTVLYYSFPTPAILVIAENPYTFAEVLNRLQAERKLEQN